MLTFTEKDHKYTSIDIFDTTEWISVSTLVSKFYEKFDAQKGAEKAVRNRKSKWYSIDVQEILDRWEAEKDRSLVLGNWYHNKQEQNILSKTTYTFEGLELPVFNPQIVEGVKVAPEQKLAEGIYPEHFVFLKSAGVCGQSDKAIIANGHIKIKDYKTNKELKVEGFKNWEGLTKKMLPPLLHLDDANLIHYALQLSTYAYIIWKHNPQMIVDEPVIEHITFEVEGEDQFGYPITRLDSNNEPIVKGVEEIKVPYLKREVELMLEFHKNSKKNGR